MMNSSQEHLALRKQLLLARSALCRLKIRCEINAIHETLSWPLACVTAINAIPLRSPAFRLALLGVTHSRLARLVTLASRLLLLVRLAGVTAKLLRKPLALAPSAREGTNGEVVDR